jgi:hypothetical protein
MGFFHKSQASNAKMPLREPLPKTPQKPQDTRKQRKVHARRRPVQQPRHDELVAADGQVVRIFAQLQSCWRSQQSTPKRSIAMKREQHRDAERKAWDRLLDYLTADY